MVVKVEPPGGREGVLIERCPLPSAGWLNFHDHLNLRDLYGKLKKKHGNARIKASAVVLSFGKRLYGG